MVVVSLGHVLGFSVALKIQVGRVTPRIQRLIFNVAENMEYFLVIVLREFELFWQIVCQVFVGAAAARLVALRLFGAHSNNFFDTLLDNCSFKVIHSEYKLEQLDQLFLRVRHDVFKPEEVDGLVRGL